MCEPVQATGEHPPLPIFYISDTEKRRNQNIHRTCASDSMVLSPVHMERYPGCEPHTSSSAESAPTPECTSGFKAVPFAHVSYGSGTATWPNPNLHGTCNSTIFSTILYYFNNYYALMSILSPAQHSGAWCCSWNLPSHPVSSHTELLAWRCLLVPRA